MEHQCPLSCVSTNIRWKSYGDAGWIGLLLREWGEGRRRETEGERKKWEGQAEKEKGRGEWGRMRRRKRETDRGWGKDKASC